MLARKTQVLYSPEVLFLASTLADYPLTSLEIWRGQSRSASCGSSLELGISRDPQGHIASIGLTARACAIGQAAAAIFAKAAVGMGCQAITHAEAEIGKWLRDDAPMPAWPELTHIAPAKAYPARHGAILLAWRAALAAFSQSDMRDTDVSGEYI